MAKSIWIIAFMAIVTMCLMMMGMFSTLDLYKDTPAGTLAKLAEAVRSQFRFDSAGARVQTEGSKNIMVISYQTSVDSKFDLSAQQKEMKEVAAFAAARYQGKDKGSIEEIRVKRTEIKGSGIWRKTYPSQDTFPNPAKGVPARFQRS